ncbi:MAG TPA: condensation domain-containing protein, partial [Thermoanaerobaculia bacterium]|nr:condensation domain-containing protein [Thermoanaerobaculia bacterium]
LAGRCRPAGDEPPILLLDADGNESLAAFSDAPLPERALPENLAYVIYTSGSTGRPKGAMNTREGLDNLVAWHLRAYAVTAADRSTLLAAPSFDASTWEIWPALAAGARLLIADDATRLAPEPVRDWLAAESATLAFLPTPLAEATLALPSPRGTSLRVLLTGGDRLRAAPRPAPPFLVVNHYGPTEATVVATASPVTATGASPPAIGRPLPNVRAYVLDAEVEPAPIGVPGELFLAGVQVGRGYLARPDLTADRFVPDPFSLVPGARLYRTGDLARLADDGAIHFLGRLDHQVKLRGFRIELGEIEATLAEHPAVAEAAVVTRGSAGREARLVAYIALRAETTVPELRAALAARLPSYMVPATFVRLDGLPRSAHGKIDRNALPIPEDGEREGFAPAATPIEDLLAGIWSDLLGVAAIGREDDFFALGGHSLLAAQVIGRTRAAFAVELPVRLVFDRPTLAAFAAEIETALAARRGPAAPPIVPMSRTGPLPLSSGQRRLWLMDQLAPGSADFVIAATFDLGPSADPGVLRRALGEILRRHEALRTTFAEVDGRPVQRIAPPRVIDLPVHDLTAVPVEQQPAAALERTAALAAEPFDLARGPLFRVALSRAEGATWLHLAIHHIVADGWSIGVFLAELRALAAAYTGGRPSPLPELPVQYADFAIWQRLAEEAYGAQLTAWRERLADAPEIHPLATDRPRPAVLSSAGASLSFRFPRSLLAALSDLARRRDATLFMVLAAAFAALLSRESGACDLILGTDVANRSRAETEGLIGAFLNQIALRFRIRRDASFSDMLATARDEILGAYGLQEVPFERVVEALGLPPDRSRAPLVQIKLVFQNLPFLARGLAASANGDDAIEPIPEAARPAIAQLDLTLFLEPTPNGLAGTFVYSTDLFEPTTVARLAREYGALLAAVTARPEATLAALGAEGRKPRRGSLRGDREARATPPPGRSRRRGAAHHVE